MKASAIRIGTRGSRLALRQTEAVADLLRRAHPQIRIAVTTVRTTADRRPEAPFEALPGIGFFVKELEIALLEGMVDAAVHSMKDLPTAATAGLRISAVPAREDPRDVLISRDGAPLEALPRGARVGTSSPRRAAFLRARRPDLAIVPVRGNVETRLRKLDAGEVDALCLAGAGLRRLGLEARVTEWIPLEVMLPAPGQGALAVQTRAEDERTGRLVASIDDAEARAAAEAERAFLARLQGGCRLPAGAHAEAAEGTLRLRAAVIAPDGRRAVRGERAGRAADAWSIGRALAEQLLADGGADLVGTERIVS